MAWMDALRIPLAATAPEARRAALQAVERVKLSILTEAVRGRRRRHDWTRPRPSSVEVAEDRARTPTDFYVVIVHPPAAGTTPYHMPPLPALTRAEAWELVRLVRSGYAEVHRVWLEVDPAPG
jgi:hypothetical protein